jgi:enhancer of mRNA-decapping protein 4
MAAFRTSFEASVVPGFERACQSMFNQLYASVQSGGGGGGGGASSAELSAVAASLQRTSNDLARSVAAMGAMGANAAAGPVVSELETNVLRFASERQYQAAFETALGGEDAGLVTKLCEMVDAGEIFVSPSPLSNVVQLCILQQVRDGAFHVFPLFVYSFIPSFIRSPSPLTTSTRSLSLSRSTFGFGSSISHCFLC